MGSRKRFPEVDGFVRVQTGYQNLGSAFQERAQNGSDMFHTFTGCEDDLREALAQLAVMVNMGKAQVFKGQVQQSPLGRLDAEAPRLHFLQKLFQD